MKTFLLWVLISVYQGGIIMIMAIVLFENMFLNIVAITFTALIMTEVVSRYCSLCAALSDNCETEKEKELTWTRK